MPSKSAGGAEVASIREFVTGYREQQKAATRASAKTIAAGVITAAVVSYYTSRDKWRR